jgi:hypothetical protein
VRQLDRLYPHLAVAEGHSPTPDILGGLGIYLAFTGHWDEGTALAEKAIKLAGPSAAFYWWWPTAKRHWLRGEYPEAYEAFQHSY